MRLASLRYPFLFSLLWFALFSGSRPRSFARSSILEWIPGFGRKDDPHYHPPRREDITTVIQRFFLQHRRFELREQNVVLITGAAGSIGHKLMLQLIDDSSRVVPSDLTNTTGSTSGGSRNVFYPVGIDSFNTEYWPAMKYRRVRDLLQPKHVRVEDGDICSAVHNSKHIAPLLQKIALNLRVVIHTATSDQGYSGYSGSASQACFEQFLSSLAALNRNRLHRSSNSKGTIGSPLLIVVLLPVDRDTQQLFVETARRFTEKFGLQIISLRLPTSLEFPFTQSVTAATVAPISGKLGEVVVSAKDIVFGPWVKESSIVHQLLLRVMEEESSSSSSSSRYQSNSNSSNRMRDEKPIEIMSADVAAGMIVDIVRKATTARTHMDRTAVSVLTCGWTATLSELKDMIRWSLKLSTSKEVNSAAATSKSKSKSINHHSTGTCRGTTLPQAINETVGWFLRTEREKIPCASECAMAVTAPPPPPPPPTTTTTTTTTTITSHSQQKQPDRLCFPSAWDAAAAESRILTENCTYAFYTVAVGGRFGKMHPLRKFRDTPPQCRVAFVDRRSTTLAKKGKSDQISIVTSSHSSTSTSNSNRSSSITSSTSYQVVSGWTIIYVSDYFPFTLSTSSRRASRVPKFCPGRFFADSVHYAFYIDNKIRIKRDVTELLRFLEPTERNGYKQSAMLMIHNRLFHTYRQEVQTLFKLRNKGRTGITLEPEMLQAQMLAYDELLQRYPGMRLHKTFDAGFIIHNLRHEFARRFRCTWFREYFDWSDRDQISSIRVIQLMGNYSMGSAHVGCHNYIPLGCASSVSDEDGKMVVRSNTSDTDHGKGEGCSHLCMLPPNFHWWSKSVKAIGDWLRLADIKSN